ncbi:hypothetical protein KIPB_004922 [Kipferlia bialata]|uniref:Uncharacterized protein n=1 Tax=Kipferlia bialata TaxID=797122 RepID=A0A9K3GI53_9EUKA|nr:hypothetical protein KIPB_004922 [Kipferlia bialata]|eukprot:g4922.t1
MEGRHYGFVYYEVPILLITCVTLVYLYVGLRIIRTMKVSGEKIRATPVDPLDRYFWLAFPIPVLRLVPTVCNALFDILMGSGSSYVSVRPLFLIATTPCICTVVAYFTPRIVLGLYERRRKRLQKEQRGLSV